MSHGAAGSASQAGRPPPTIDACDRCLERGHLVGHLAPGIARLEGRSRAAGLLALAEDELVAVCGASTSELAEFRRCFDVGGARSALARMGLGAVCRHEAAYPERLLALDDPPSMLFIAGDDRPLGRLAREPAVALVGTRRPSPYGLEMAYELGRGVGAAGVTVISGLALGVDAAAHRGCVDARGAAIAVLPGGVDVPYPRSNHDLYERVRATGAVVSELPPGRRAYRWSFPARNRIMAGLADMVVVVEAAEPSGSLITSTFAGQLGRTVAAVPGRATSRFSAGSNRLLKDGARVITSARDVLDELFGVGVRDESGPRRAAAGSRGDLGALEQRALDAVEAGLGVDDLCAHTGLPAGEVRALLARLEAAGHLRRDGLGGYRRTAAHA